MLTLMYRSKLFSVFALLVPAVMLAILPSCDTADTHSPQEISSNAELSALPNARQSQEKTFIYGTTSYSVEMDDVGLNPHKSYSGWSCVRYGVGETLFRFNQSMEIEPWLAAGYTFIDKTHLSIDLRKNIYFTSGRNLDAQAVKECLDDLIRTHQRAANDMKIAKISTKENSVIIETKEACPTLIHHLCDPYAAIIDMRLGITQDNKVSGTGPYEADTITNNEIVLHKNENYWAGTPHIDTLVVCAFKSTDALQSALQSGEIDAACGLEYSSYQLFENENYSIADCFTTRTIIGQANWTSPVIQDEAVRTALVLGIDKNAFVQTLMHGHGQAAKGPFPSLLAFGDNTVSAENYDPERAANILEEAGWIDSNHDGIREKAGQRLTINWLTYPGRAELPFLAEFAQASLKRIGIEVKINSTANHGEIRKNQAMWDIYVNTLITAPTGDPEYFFSSVCLENSTRNFGAYKSDKLEKMATRLHTTFDSTQRAHIATKMTQQLLDERGFFFVSFLQMGIVSRSYVTGIAPQPCDYYEITVDLDVKND